MRLEFRDGLFGIRQPPCSSTECEGMVGAV